MRVIGCRGGWPARSPRSLARPTARPTATMPVLSLRCGGMRVHWQQRSDMSRPNRRGCSFKSRACRSAPQLVRSRDSSGNGHTVRPEAGRATRRRETRQPGRVDAEGCKSPTRVESQENRQRGGTTVEYRALQANRKRTQETAERGDAWDTEREERTSGFSGRAGRMLSHSPAESAAAKDAAVPSRPEKARADSAWR